MLQEEVSYATEEVERLTKVLDEQNILLQASQEQTAQKDIMIQNLKQKVKYFVVILTEKLSIKFKQSSNKEGHVIKNDLLQDTLSVTGATTARSC